MFYFIQAIKKSFVFRGKSTRKEYLHFMIVNEIALVILMVIPLLLNSKFSYNHVAVLIVYIIITFFPTLTVSVRRLHDIGFSGWWIILIAIYRRGVSMLFTNNIFDFKNPIIEEFFSFLLFIVPTIILGSLPSVQVNNQNRSYR